MRLKGLISFILPLITLVGCNTPEPNSTSETEYILADVKFLGSTGNSYKDVVYWQTDEKGEDYFCLPGIYPMEHTGNFLPHKEKIYCWIEHLGGDCKLDFSPLCQRENGYVICDADDKLGKRIDEQWYTIFWFLCVGKRGDCDFRVRFYLPERDVYMTTPILRMTTHFDTPVIVLDFEDEEDVIFNYDVIYISTGL